jgi:hypothetical protein
MLLAGLAPRPAPVVPDENTSLMGSGEAPGYDGTADLDPEARSGEPGVGEVPAPESIPAFLRGAARFLLLRCAPLALCIVGIGLVLTFFGRNDAWVPVFYVAVVTGWALVQGLALPERNVPLRDFFWVSLFFVLSTPLLQFAPMGMDHYNFHMVADLSGTPMPYLLALLVNLSLATVATLLFQLLMNRTAAAAGAGGYPNAFRRAALTALPPVVLVYATVVVLSNASVWLQLAAAMPVLAGVFTILLVLHDPSVCPTERDQRLLFPTTVAVGLVTSAIGMVVIVLVYISPDVPAVLPDHNLLRSWEIDFAQLGYSRADALERLNVGYMWHALCLFGYMAFVVGGTLIVSIYRMDGEGGARSTGVRAASTVPAAEAGSPPAVRQRLSEPVNLLVSTVARLKAV